MFSNPDAKRGTGEGEFVGYANVYRNPKNAPLWEQGLLFMWFVATTVPLPGITAVLYLCVLSYLVILAFDYRTITPLILQAWPLFLLPLYGLWSFTWSPYPAQAFRSGLLFLLTPLIMVIIAARFNTHQVVRAFMFALIVAAIYSTPHIATFNQGGVYASKNYFAYMMLFLLLTALASGLNPDENVVVRLVALAFVPVAFVYQYLAESATSLVLGVLGILGMLVMRFAWLSIGKVRHLRTVIFFAVMIVSISIVLTILSLPQNSLVQDFFNAIGKDTTFSGRTAIWEGARLQSAKYPLFGTGLEGFWQYDNGLAQTLNENDHKEYGTKLSFHSAYWEVRVHLGLVGWTLFVLSFVWCVWGAATNWLKNPTMATSALLVMVFIVFTSTFTESHAWGTFTPSTNMLFFAALTRLGAGGKKLVGLVPVRLSRDGKHQADISQYREVGG